jgi:hypothetical protein
MRHWRVGVLVALAMACNGACNGVGKEGDLAPTGVDGGVSKEAGRTFEEVVPDNSPTDQALVDGYVGPDGPIPESCGNDQCDPGEDPCSCSVDCASDATCCQDLDCPQPQCGPCCKAVCVNFECVEGWLAPCCFNGECEAGENHQNCPEDCALAPGCGDGICQAGEDGCSCAKDCPGIPECCEDADCPQPSCGPCCKSVCQDQMCLPVWLSPCCWNNECEAGEDYQSCPEDCPAPKTECESKGGVCVGWDPDYSQCPPGTGPTGLMCENKNQVCCQKETNPGDCDTFKCAADADCVKTDAGCCPCTGGGDSIAVAEKCEKNWLAALNCPPEIACPPVDACDDSYPACMGNQCVLLGGGTGPK